MSFRKSIGKVFEERNKKLFLKYMNLYEILVIAFVLLINISFLGMMLGMMLHASFGVPFIPSGRRTVKRMVEIAEIKPGDRVFDFGCGDGRLVFLSGEKGAKATGIEFSPAVFLLAKIRGLFQGSSNTKIRYGNFFSPRFSSDIESAHLVFAFFLPSLMAKFFREIFPKMKPGSRIISHAFTPKGITPTRVIPRDKKHGKIFVFEKD